MKHIVLFLMACTLLLGSCIQREKDLYDEEAVMKRDIMENASSILGHIDENQDWSTVVSANVTVVADASLDDIVKVQILTGAPYFNSEARVLNEVKASKGQTVTVSCDVPSNIGRLVAACVSSKGIYYIKGFNVGQTTVSFAKEGSNSRATRATRADGDDFPTPSDLVFDESKSCLSYNAMRTIKAGEGETTNHIDIWAGKGWQDERLWRINDKGSTPAWTVVNQTIVQRVDPMSDADKAELEDIFSTYLDRTKTNGKQKDNLGLIRNSELFSYGNNYMTTDGVNPVMLTPVQMASTEIGDTHLYYYYFSPSDIMGMSDDEAVSYLKSLPKYKAIQCWHTRSEANRQGMGTNSFFNIHRYLLPYYGDGVPASGQTAQSIVFPKGYKIGLMLRKMKSNSNDCYNGYKSNSYTAVNNGCVYGDGRLNKEINSFAGHFGSSVTFYSMNDDDPRMAIFGANGKTFITIEDGSDCNFSDMIVQIEGVDTTDEPQEVDSQMYTMLFEDKPKADYDLNDVVLKLARVDASHVKVSLVACGANDALYLRGLHGNKLNETTEIHAIFGKTTSDFVNTKKDIAWVEPVEEVFEVPANATLEALAKTLYVYDETENRNVTLAGKGDDPHAIMIAADFDYPLEGICIKKAYPNFLNWVSDATTDTDWYLYPEAELTYQR